jgi:hypothetical protein
MRILTILFILFAIISCKTNKVETQKTIIKVDTFRTEKIVHIYDTIKDTLIVENPCDSSGILTRFYSKITIPQGRIIIRSYNGKIEATINIDSLKSIYESKYRNKETNLSQNATKIVTRNIIPTWCFLTIIFQGLLIFGYIYIKFIYV